MTEVTLNPVTPLTGGAIVSDTNAFPVKGISGGTPIPTTHLGTSATSRSGTITTGGVAQNAMAANTSRNTWTLTNSSDTLIMVNASAAASATVGIALNPGDVAWGDETNAISVFGATTGKAFTAWEN